MNNEPTDTMSKQLFSFIGDLITTDEQLQLPIKLFDGFYLKKASPEQITIIRNFITSHSHSTAFSDHHNKYQTTYTKNDKDGYNLNPITNIDDWKYCVIEYSKINASATLAIQPVLSLSSLDLTILFEVMMWHATTDGGYVPGIGQMRLRTLNYIHDTECECPPQTKTITNQSIEELNCINSLLSQFDKTRFPFIDKALADFASIKDISKQSPFKILSCFSTLELLLTTYRRSKTDSLSLQLKKKINLLNNQFENKIEIQNYFKGSDQNTLETLVGKLYDYRNDIAHGNSSDFENDLQILGNSKENILSFLLELLRRILIFALKQPQLVADLKAC